MTGPGTGGGGGPLGCSGGDRDPPPDACQRRGTGPGLLGGPKGGVSFPSPTPEGPTPTHLDLPTPLSPIMRIFSVVKISWSIPTATRRRPSTDPTRDAPPPSSAGCHVFCACAPALPQAAGASSRARMRPGRRFRLLYPCSPSSAPCSVRGIPEPGTAHA